MITICTEIYLVQSDIMQNLELMQDILCAHIKPFVLHTLTNVDAGGGKGVGIERCLKKQQLGKVVQY